MFWLHGMARHAFRTRHFSWWSFPLQLVLPWCRWDSLAVRHGDSRWKCHVIINAAQTHRNNRGYSFINDFKWLTDQRSAVCSLHGLVSVQLDPQVSTMENQKKRASRVESYHAVETRHKIWRTQVQTKMNEYKDLDFVQWTMNHIFFLMS